MSFDMKANGVKVGDKLITVNGRVCELEKVDVSSKYPYSLVYHRDLRWTVTEQGRWSTSIQSPVFDIFGFADENQQANCTFTEMQAVELLLSLGYTLKKGV